MRKISYLFLALAFLSCNKNKDNGTPPVDGYKTENVVIIVVDGPRYSETWGEGTRQYIPNRAKMLADGGVFISNFRNNGQTVTNPGHSAVLTGKYQDIDNSGKTNPATPSIFQQWLKYTKAPASKAWIITSKDKLQILNNTTNAEWKDQFIPSTDCGANKGTGGYRTDDETVASIKTIVARDKPRLIFVNLLGPDSQGHAGNWPGYLAAIKSTDAQVKEIWDLLQADPQYKDKTTLVVTNDHGRHTDGIKEGFKEHGDDCEGCRHIEFFAMGPDFKKNATITDTYEQKDVAATVAQLLKLPLVFNEGKVITPIFK